MIQNIEPHVLDNSYSPRPPQDRDFVLIYCDKQAILKVNANDRQLPTYNELPPEWQIAGESLIYLFSVDGTAFFLSLRKVDESDTLKYEDALLFFRTLRPKWLAFSGSTATHLARWYDGNKFCGECASATEVSVTERAIVCPACGTLDFPQISPVVIVGITNGERLLLIKHANGYDRYALVAGYVEIGETLEEAVKREVMEEVGLCVNNIRYYKSQPWAFSQSLLMGFFADVVGDDSVSIDKAELSEGTWFHRSEIPKDDTTISLTWNMIEAFRSDVCGIVLGPIV